MDAERNRDAAIGISVYAAVGIQSIERRRYAKSGAAVVESGVSGRGDDGESESVFNPNAFLVPANGTYGNVGRDTLIGPGSAAADFSALKNTALTDRVRLQIRGEFFNILNHANFGTPNTIVFSSATAGPSPTAGVITATSTPSRQIQFGAKLIW